jgi:selenocysteine-specific elongation factor
MKYLVAGTAGHIDHGKTTLVKALTGIDTDRLKEEKARGITIELGFAHLDIPGGIRLGIVDVPGHERFVRTMVAGAGGIDLVMLVIAADEGVMPQTREHLDICRLLGVQRGVVILTKSDLVESEWLDLVTEEVRDYLAGSFLEDSAIVAISSRTGERVDTLREELLRLAHSVPEREHTGPFRLPVDRVFTMPGFGAVVTGTLWSGVIRVGDAVEVLPSGRLGRVRGLQVYGRKEEQGVAGQRVAVNLQGIDHHEVARGETLAPPDTFRTTRTVDVRLDSLPSARELKHRSTVRVHSGAAETSAQVIFPERETLRPGESAPAQLRLRDPLLLFPGDPFVLRCHSPATTIGGGRVLDPAPLRRRRRNEDAVELLTALDGADAAAKVRLLVRDSRLTGMSVKEIGFRGGLGGSALEAAVGQLLSRGDLVQALKEPRMLLTREAFSELEEHLLAALGAFLAENPLRDGMGKEEMKGRLPKRSDPRFFGALLAALVKEGKLSAERDLVKPASGMATPVTVSGGVRDALAVALQQGGAEPPTVKELSERLKTPEKVILEHLAVLVREGRAIRAAHDLYYAPEPLATLRDRLTVFLGERGEITPSGFRELSGLSRKFMIPVLEYFDSIKLTIRVGDVRRLRRG